MRRAPRRGAWLSLVAAAVAFVLGTAACGLVRDVDALSRDYGKDDAAAGDAGPVAPDGAAPGTCASPGIVGRGPVLVAIPGTSSCIDATEVAYKDYRAFLDDKKGDVSGQPAECAWNTTWDPDFPRGDDDPVTNVDWCDARAFCAWAGKRLCGVIGGGGFATTASNDDETGAWLHACNGGDPQRTYPYGKDYDAQRCSGVDRKDGDVHPVGRDVGCQGAVSGVFDLSGNVREWEDACDPVSGDPKQRTCLARGGAFYDIGSTLACTNRQPMTADTHNPGVGFRCCSK